MEITRSNFLDNFDDITKDLKQACFVGFDAEFTALLSSDAFKHRLFDTIEDRYNKMKTEVSKMIMTQVGLTMFRYNRDLDQYVATGYTFHLCPQAFADIDQAFMFQASTVEFLCKNNFDFNKFTYQGIPYLSKVDEEKIRNHLKNGSLFTNITRHLTLEDERLLQRHCSEVSKWLSQDEEDTMYIDIHSPVMRFLIHVELRQRFPNLLTTDSLGNSNKLLIYKNKDIDGATSKPKAELEGNLMSHLLGFSRVIGLLESFKKPIIGHNVYMDLVLLHNQFIGPLPKKYCEFKENISNVFPVVFDTKYVSFEMARKLTMDEVWKSNALQDLYEFFNERKCKKLENGVNNIKLSTPFNKQQSYHEAGWDSYCTGYCFIRLGHWAASENIGHQRPVTPSEMMAALSRHQNRVNVIRGAVPYMNLAGKDPPSHRPELMYLCSRNGSGIDIIQMAALLANYGSIDIKPHGRRAALVVASTRQTADRILKQFKDDKEFRVTLYKSYKHSFAGRMAMWSGALATGSLVIYLLRQKIKS